MSYLTEKQREQFFAMRKCLDNFVTKIVDSPTEINESSSAIRLWKPSVFELNDVRLYNETPYKCVQAHDSTGNSDWTPDATPSLWMQYHGTSLETARPWVAPIGAHDMYKVGEYMLWTDNNIYKCTYDTTYSPTEYAQAWDIVE